MQFCFSRDGTDLVMPVTPGSYRWGVGRRMETINISAVGDVYRPGGRSRFSGSFCFLLPAQEYPWMEAGARAEPPYYIDRLERWCADGRSVRLIITGTPVNIGVYLEAVVWEERDGTGDVYLTVTVREHVELAAVQQTAGTGEKAKGNIKSGAANLRRAARVATYAAAKEQRYTIAAGDCLSVICRRFYGDGSARYYSALAAYNGIKNPHLIYAGRTLKIPPASVLLGGSA